MPELTLFELNQLVGDGASAAQLRDAAESLAAGYALEQADGVAWVLVGWTGRENRARQWVTEGGEPDRPPPVGR